MPVLQGWSGHGVDVAVVGAGAAGLAAARRLSELRPDLSVLVLEAADRIGGRAFTLPNSDGIDLGCGWLHGARDNAWTAVAADLGLAVDRSPAPWNREMRASGLSAKDRQAAREALDGFFERINARRPGKADAPMSAYLEPGNPWNGFIGAVGTYINGAELELASTEDFERYEPGRPPDWRVRDGYGHLVATYGAPAPVVLSTAVTRIDHGRAGAVMLDTGRGTLRCRAAVVTVSSTCLAEGAIRFDPPLPDKQAAAAGVPLGVANKVFLDLAAPEALPEEVYVHGATDRVATGAYHLRPLGRPLVECYYGGALARDVETLSPEAAASFAIDELVGCYGTDLRRHLSLRARSVWAGNLWARGAYSYARPGQVGARAILARAVEDRLFFAGEACSPHRFSTAHGAYETGLAAAAAVSAAVI